ncbi:hypothetical protein L6452_16556 [Arctium lappa]|uniref:Uncharacterized protein n=1 Tax=Arctium lappa TaxID=4217 RepID=A0ACB9C0X8_ARCLA|nr:hypothetical protein L6452_16556 [Arctium lappa]
MIIVSLSPSYDDLRCDSVIVSTTIWISDYANTIWVMAWWSMVSIISFPVKICCTPAKIAHRIVLKSNEKCFTDFQEDGERAMVENIAASIYFLWLCAHVHSCIKFGVCFGLVMIFGYVFIKFLHVTSPFTSLYVKSMNLTTSNGISKWNHVKGVGSSELQVEDIEAKGSYKHPSQDIKE